MVYNYLTKKLLDYLFNNNIVITFVMSKNKSDMSEKVISKERSWRGNCCFTSDTTKSLKAENVIRQNLIIRLKD